MKGNNMDYSIRTANAGEKERINALFIEMLNTIYQKADSEGYEEGYLDKFFAGGEDLIYVAEVEGEAAAFLSVEVYRDGGYIYLDDFAVTEKCRGLGIGKALLHAAEAYAVEIGVGRIALHVEKSNVGAYRLYHKMGYGDYEDQGERMLMLKKLAEEGV